MLPIKIYSNAEADKATILKENKNKSGIYMWKNLINDKCYIGSAIDLSDRLKFYFSTKAMENQLKNSQSYIYHAIIKYGHSNFSLTILEYCSPEQCIEREDFYLSSEKHEYNILPKAGSWLGHQHSDETKIIMSEAKKGENNPMFGKTGENNPMYGKNHTEESKKIMSDIKKGQPRPSGAGRPSQIFKQ